MCVCGQRGAEGHTHTHFHMSDKLWTQHEVWKNKTEFIKTTKRTLSTQEHYQRLRYEAVEVIFLLHGEETNKQIQKTN